MTTVGIIEHYFTSTFWDQQTYIAYFKVEKTYEENNKHILK